MSLPVLAVDPDMKTPAFACVGYNGTAFKVHYLGLGKVTTKKADHEVGPSLSAVAMARALQQLPLRPHALALVEGQMIYTHVRQKPQDIMRLAQAAGACAGVLLSWGLSARLVEPGVWKGQVPKEVCQARAYSRLGWTYEKHARKSGSFAIPDARHVAGIPSVGLKNAGDWKHLGDAVALAIWGCLNLPWFRGAREPYPPPL